jgi:hypothetical protein
MARSQCSLAGLGWSTKKLELDSWQVLEILQTGSGVHPVSFPVGTRVCLSEVEAEGHEFDHKPASSANVENG